MKCRRMNAQAAIATAAYHGYDWTLDAEAPPGVSALIQAFPDPGLFPGAQTIKSNHFRSVFRIPGGASEPGPGFIAKVYRYTSSWDRLRYRWIRHRALQEWSALRRFAELGLPTARAWAVAEQCESGRLMGGGLVVELLADTKPLSERAHELFLDPTRACEGFGALEDAAKLVLRAHDCGVWHRDLHAGNLLLGSAGRLYLIDLHTCVFQRSLWRWQRRNGLAKLLHSLKSSIPPEGFRRIVDAYGADALGGTPEAVLRDLLRRVDRIHRVRVKSRSRRCFLPSTQFQVTRGKGRALYHLRSMPSGELEPLFRPHPPGPQLKTSPRGWVARGEAQGRAVCVKHRRLGILESLQALFESHRLRRAYGGGHALSIRGIATPKIIALCERRSWGLVREAYLVTELLEDALPLDQFLFRDYWGTRASPQATGRKRRLAEAVGALVRKIHDLGLYPHDLSPQNLLVIPSRLGVVHQSGAADSAPAPTAPWLYLTDLDHLYLWKPLWRGGRIKNLSDIANLPEGHVSTIDRLRGLKAYAAGDSELWSSDFVAELRQRILREHWKVLNGYLRRERSIRDAPAS